ncbi:glycosyltransferase [Mammaliicoccus sciuri]|uniref:glycosyltransferase n=1 Tax=Mammaliicoccus sciuri TaxID=1296 RepID=UPI0034DCE9B3
MKKGHLSLITSNMEGFSLAILESISNGLPVISYDIAYRPREMINDNFNGFLITKNDQVELYKKTKELLKNKQLQQDFRKNSINKSNEFSSDNMQLINGRIT